MDNPTFPPTLSRVEVARKTDYFQMKLHMPDCLPRLLLMKINLKVRYLTSKTPHPNTEINLI